MSDQSIKSRVTGPSVVALSALAAAQFMVVLDSSIVNVALPSIRDELGLTGSQVSWVVDGYLVAFGGLLLLGGRVSDVFPRRAVFLGGLTVFALASAACAFAPSGTVLVVSRVVQGIGGALLAPSALSIVMHLFAEGAGRARALGVWGGVSGAGGIAGVLLGGVLSETVGWPWIFLINLPLALIAGFVVLRVVASFPPQRGTFDLAGAVSVSVALAAIAFGLVSGSEHGWLTGQTLGALALGVVALAGFLVAETRASRPLVPLSTFRRPRLVTADALMTTLGAVMVGLFYYLPQYQQARLGMSPLTTSLAQAPMAVMISLGGLLAARIAARVGGVRNALIGSLGALLAGLSWLAAVPAGAGWVVTLLGPFLLIGAGLGVSTVYVTTLAVAGAEPGEAGLVSGLVNAARQIGGAIGLAVLVAVAVGAGHAGAPDFTAAFLTAGGLAALALVLAALPALRDPAGTA